MSRAQKLLIEQHESTIAGLREQVSGMRGELTGERRGESRVTAQLARDIERSAQREQDARMAASRAVVDVRRLLGLLATAVVDVRAGAEAAPALEELVTAVTATGLPIGNAIIRHQIELADAATRSRARMSAEALLTAPVPPRTT
jgi:hypothetical protein